MSYTLMAGELTCNCTKASAPVFADIVSISTRPTSGASEYTASRTNFSTSGLCDEQPCEAIVNRTRTTPSSRPNNSTLLFVEASSGAYFQDRSFNAALQAVGMQPVKHQQAADKFVGSE